MELLLASCLTFCGSFHQNKYRSEVKEKLFRKTKYSILGSYELFIYRQNLSTCAYKGVAYKKNRVFGVGAVENPLNVVSNLRISFEKCMCVI